MATDAGKLHEELKNGSLDGRLLQLYGRDSSLKLQRERYEELINSFLSHYGERPVEIYSAPGRTEICGNHTDHQNGCVIAGAVTDDILAVAAEREDRKVHLFSEGYAPVCVDLDENIIKDKEAGTTAALVKGMAAGLKPYAGEDRIRGFDAVLSSRVPSGSGMSSSAAVEILIGNIFAGLFLNPEAVYGTKKKDGVRECTLPFAVELAKVGQKAENLFFGKPSGMMDQLACSAGGLLYMDFEDPANPLVEKTDGDHILEGYHLCLVDTGSSHADLSDAYAEIPRDMKAAAACFGKEKLREVTEQEFFGELARVRHEAGDRALLRAMHFFGENRRVKNVKEALKNQDADLFLDMERKSGDSSYKLLQNIIPSGSSGDQSLALALAAAEEVLQGRGAVRVHGGGFAGTIQAYVPDSLFPPFRAEMDRLFGDGACREIVIRKSGGCFVAG